jgi:hypothetical protein
MTLRKFGTVLVLAGALAGTAALGGCINGVATNEYARGEAGELTQVEAATVVSQRLVNLSSAWPFGLGVANSALSRQERVSLNRMGVTYVVRLEKTGETLSITQANDVSIANGAPAWVEFGRRVRVYPR